MQRKLKKIPDSTGIKGLDIILNHQEFPPNEAKKGFRLLIRGVPGTGKTTLGLHLINNHLKKNSSFIQERMEGLIVYLQEEISSMDHLSELFQLDFKEYPPDTVRVGPSEYRRKFPFINHWIREKVANKAHEVKLCIFIDGLSLAMSTFNSSQTMHDFILRLLTELPRKNVFLIIATEDNLLTNDNFFQHLVDCVIDLTISENIQRHRFLEIKKCRYIDYFRGKHGFEMYRNENNKSTLQIYPSPACHFLLARKQNDKQQCDEKTKEAGGRVITSGIVNLERIIRGSSSQENFIKLGDSFVITTEPGTDKISFGLSFLSNIDKNKPEHKSVWVSFGYSPLDRTLFFETYKKRFHYLSENYCKYNPKGLNKNFVEIDRPSTVMHPDRILFQLTEYLSKNKESVVRVVIDGINNTGREFNDSNKVTEYIFMIIRILRYFGAIGIVFLDLQKNLQPLNHISMEWAEEADFVGHLGRKKVKNKLIQTFMVSKSRYPKFSTKLYEIKNDDNNTKILNLAETT